MAGVLAREAARLRWRLGGRVSGGATVAWAVATVAAAADFAPRAVAAGDTWAAATLTASVASGAVALALVEVLLPARFSRTLLGAVLLSHRWVGPFGPLGNTGVWLLTPLLLVVALSPLACVLVPSVYRTLVFYGHLAPIALGYVKTGVMDIHLMGITEQAERDRLWAERHEWGAARTKEMLETLGGFYVKVGQIFASKGDLLPQQYIPALRGLLDNCPARPFSLVRETVERELGRPLFEVFETFAEEPLASATVAQVHTATLKGGARVAVKVQHPGIKELMKMDMRNVFDVSHFADEHMKVKLPVDHLTVLQEYQKQVPLEFDFDRERAVMESTREALVKYKVEGVVVPQPKTELCTKQMLVMDFLKGLPLSTVLENAAKAKIQAQASSTSELHPPQHSPELYGRNDMNTLVRRLIDAYGVMFFLHGTFHADPHPGNVMLLETGELGLLDFGLSKVLPEHTRILWAKLQVAVACRQLLPALPILTDLGLRVENVSTDIVDVLVYVMFDTRMDQREYRWSPLDNDDQSVEMRGAQIPTIPEDLFMIIRVMALLRGILAGLGIDLSASIIWETAARQALKDAGVEPPVPEGGAGNVPEEAKSTGFDLDAKLSLYDRMFKLALWMREHNLPHNRKELTPFAMNGVSTVCAIAAAEQSVLNSAMESFTPAQRALCVEKAREYAERMKVEAAQRRERGSDTALSAVHGGFTAVGDGVVSAGTGVLTGASYVVEGSVNVVASILTGSLFTGKADLKPKLEVVQWAKGEKRRKDAGSEKKDA